MGDRAFGRRSLRWGSSGSIAETGGDRAFTICNVVVLTLFALSVLYPLIYIASASVSDPQVVNTGRMLLWPVNFTTEAYSTILEYRSLVTGFMNSVFYAVAGTLISVTLTLLAGYPLSRKDLYGRGVLMVFFIIPFLFTGGIIPTYLVVHDLGLLNTRWAMILPSAVAVWNVLITTSFFRVTIPDELLEAARIDGCSDFRFFVQIVLPLSKAVIAVNVLFYGVAQWNSWFPALIYLTNDDLFPLQLELRNILILNTVNPSQVADADLLAQQQALRDLLKYALIVIASLPPLLAYPFVQKHFVRGVMLGSLKG